LSSIDFYFVRSLGAKVAGIRRTASIARGTAFFGAGPAQIGAIDHQGKIADNRAPAVSRAARDEGDER
jgi:hypothetical protein